MYIIGDVHGCYKTLLALLNTIDVTKGVCFVGDLIDRGPSSKEVIKLIKDNALFDCVKGNHEDMMINSFQNENFDLWLYKGGIQTINSYGIEINKLHDISITSRFMKDLKWINTLPIIIKYEFGRDKNLIVSHSSASEYILSGYKKELEDVVLWERDSYPKSINGFFNIFGHTPHKDPVIKDHFACIDTGCFAVKQGFGFLTALEYPSMKIFQQRNIDYK